MQLEAWLLMGGVTTVAAGALAWLNRDVIWPGDAHNEAAKQESNPIAAMSSPTLPADHLAVMRYDKLLVATGTSGLVREIQEKFGFADENFKRDVVPVLERFAEFVQLLPASESHHHAQPGGLLIHLLEVARNALHFRDALKLPQGASPEEQSRLAPRWTYGVFLAALLHDIGKPIADVRVTMYEQDPRRGKNWNGLAGTMLDAAAASYTVNFPESRDYGLHQKLPVILLRSMVPISTLQWLADDLQLLQLVMRYLSGENKDNILSDIVGKADRESVGKNLLVGARTRFASARAVPVIERLMLGLRRMLDEGTHLPLNRPGAAGFIVDECAWFVAGTVADRVRAYLNKNEVRRDGAAGLPEDNSKIFDVWQDYGSVIRNARGGSMWKITVQIGEWKETFTVLRFPLAKLYRDKSAWPEICPGTITINDDPVAEVKVSRPAAPTKTPTKTATRLQDSAVTATDAATDTAMKEMNAEDQSENISENIHENASDEDQVTVTAQEEFDQPDDSINTEHTEHIESLEEPIQEYLDEEVSAAAAFHPPTQRRLPPSLMRAPMAAATKSLVRGEKDGQVKTYEAVEKLMAWIQGSLADGSVIYNDSSAMIHFVEEGMLLLTPKIIQEFVKLFGVEGDGDLTGTDDGRSWLKLQREFQRSGYPARNAEMKGSYIFAYATTNTQSHKPVNCYLIPDPERLINPVPPVNPFFVSKAAKLLAMPKT